MDDWSGDDLDPTDAGDVAGLAKYLMQLWLRSGRPPYRKVEAETATVGGYLPRTRLTRLPLRRTVLSQALTGRSLPSKAFFLTFVEFCGVDLTRDRRWERAWEHIALSEGEPAPRLPELQPQPASLNGPDISTRQETAYQVAFVSLDIAGHTAAPVETQMRNVIKINQIVADVIRTYGSEQVAWASGGDGGHVILPGQDWRQPATELIVEFRRWATSQEVQLRTSAHYGAVLDIAGADGRRQFVGDGINFADWVLGKGSTEGVVVSEAFKQAFEQNPNASVIFHDKRVLLHKNLSKQYLWLASFEPEPERSRWARPVASDRKQLTLALNRADSWAVLFHAKRLLQINPDDAEAIDAIHQLAPANLTHHTADKPPLTNPFLGSLEPSILREIVQLGELIERGYNDVICRYGDRGDTMFVILTDRSVYIGPKDRAQTALRSLGLSTKQVRRWVSSLSLSAGLGRPI